MSYPSLVDRIADLLKFQLPAFIREEHQNFIVFLEAYHEWLESKYKNKIQAYYGSVNLIDYSDVDKTLTEFIKYFSSEFLVHIPQQILCDRRKLLKNIKQFYRSRGNEKAFELLFRIMFQDKIDFYYPTVDILRPDEGKWVLKKSIRCIRQKEINPFDLNLEFLNKKITGNRSGASGIVDYIIQYDTPQEKVFEIFFKKNSIDGVFAPWETVAVSNDSFKKVQIQPILVEINLQDGGNAYAQNIPVTISNPYGIKMEAVISEVDSNGKILNLQILNPSFGYPVYPTDYLNNPLVVFENHGEETAVASAVMGALFEYPGYYVNTDGFLDTVEKLRDDYYYQEFSYVLRTHTNLVDWLDVIRKICHPAGTIVFNNLLVEPDAVFIGPKIGSDGGIFVQIKSDSLNVVDVFNGVPIYKIFEIFEGDGSKSVFSLLHDVVYLSAIPSSEQQVKIFVDGVRVYSFRFEDNKIIFHSPPSLNSKIEIEYYTTNNTFLLQKIVQDIQKQNYTKTGSILKSINKDAYRNLPTQMHPSNLLSLPNDYLIDYANYSLDNISDLQLIDLLNGHKKTPIQPRPTITVGGFYIRGLIQNSGVGLPGIQVTAEGPIGSPLFQSYTTYTNDFGEYLITNLPIDADFSEYLIIPSDISWTFIPDNVQLDIKIDNVADFDSIAVVGNYISGYIYQGVTPQPGATVSLTDLYLDSNGFTGGTGIVFATVRSGDYLFVGGTFTHYRGNPCNRIAKINVTTGEMDTSFISGSGFNNDVRALLVDGDDLYVGGLFSNYNGTTRQGVAKLHTATGALDLTFDTTTGCGGASPVVNNMVFDGSSLYLAGAMQSYKSVVRNRMCKVSAITAALDLTFDTSVGFGSETHGLSLIGNDLYVCGGFTTCQGSTRQRVAKLNATTAALDATFNSATGFNDIARRLIIDGNDLYVIGQFTTYKSIARQRIAKLNATTAAIDATFDSSTGFNDTGRNFILDGGYLYCVGAFTSYKSISRYRIAKIDSTDGSLDLVFHLEPGKGFNDLALDLVLDDNGVDLYVVGVFTEYNHTMRFLSGGIIEYISFVNVSRERIVKINAITSFLDGFLARHTTTDVVGFYRFNDVDNSIQMVKPPQPPGDMYTYTPDYINLVIFDDSVEDVDFN